MRRGGWRRCWACPLGLAAVLAGCGAPAGTDGDLINGWPALPTASYAPPATGTCLTAAVSAFEPSAAPTQAVDCAEPHTVEVVGAGTVPDGAARPPGTATRAAPRSASATRPPPRTSAATGAPAGSSPSSGSRCPRSGRPAGGNTCAGSPRATDDLFAPLERTGSVKGGLAQAGPLALTCVQLTGADVDAKGFYGSVDAVKPVDCDTPHDTEFVGAWTAPAGGYPTQQRLKQLASDACYLKIAQFLGISQTQLFQRADIYTFWTGLTPSQWALGDRTAHCFLNVSTKTPLLASIRDLGTKKLP